VWVWPTEPCVMERISASSSASSLYSASQLRSTSYDANLRHAQGRPRETVCTTAVVAAVSWHARAPIRRKVARRNVGGGAGGVAAVSAGWSMVRGTRDARTGPNSERPFGACFFKMKTFGACKKTAAQLRPGRFMWRRSGRRPRQPGSGCVCMPDAWQRRSSDRVRMLPPAVLLKDRTHGGGSWGYIHVRPYIGRRPDGAGARATWLRGLRESNVTRAAAS
jgi:hypothetical protein